jgi:small GTP-binding protein
MTQAAPRVTCLKVIFVGETQVGKSCIIDRHLNDNFEDPMPNTIGTAFASTIVDTPEGPLRIQIWDTAGQERYISLASLYYRNANVALLVFDLTRSVTFKSLAKWAHDVRERAQPNVKLIIVGNKCDLAHKRQVNPNEITDFKAQIGASFYFETSAKTGAGLVLLFQAIVELRFESGESAAAGVQLTSTTSKKRDKKCC